ncbi:peptidoglycan-binding protein [Candidatus Parcubacteria bacterium]|nr:peptidoglycan-binding protein [Candidatus Parcubacteria bacterium]
MIKLNNFYSKLKPLIPKIGVFLAVLTLSISSIAYAQFARQTGSIGWGYGYGYGYGLGYGWDSGLSAGYRSVPSAWSLTGESVLVGIFPSNDTSTAVATDGTVYVAYPSSITDGYRPFLKKYSNGSWSTVGGTYLANTSSGVLSLAISPTTDVPYVAFADGENGNRLTVMKYEDDIWSVVGSELISTGSANDIDLLVAPNGIPAVAYYDGTTDRAAVQYYYGSSWIDISPGASDGGISKISISIDSAGVPVYISYVDTYNGSGITAMQYSGSGWSGMGARSFTSGVAYDVSMAVDSNNVPYIAFKDDAGYASVVSWNGSSWVSVGPESFSDGLAVEFNLAMDSDTPYISYIDYGNNRYLTVQKYINGSWQDVGDPGFVEGRYSSLAISPGGTPYLAYLSLENGGIGVQEYSSDSSDASLNSYGYGYGYMVDWYSNGSSISWVPGSSRYEVSGEDMGVSVVSAGLMIPNTSSIEAATAISFPYPLYVDMGDTNITINAGTIMTAATTTNFLTIGGDESADLTNLPSDQTSVASLDFGLPSLGLTISPAVTISRNVGSSYNGEELNIYHRTPGESTWTLLGTCTVASSICSFTTTQLSSFAVTQTTTTTTSSSSNGGSGGGGYPDGYFDDVVEPNSSDNTSNSNGSSCQPTNYTYTRNLKINYVGQDVLELQKTLNNNDFIIGTTGNGSPGNESTYFGQATEYAVKSLQSFYNLVSDGIVGSGTGSVIESLANCENVVIEDQEIIPEVPQDQELVATNPDEIQEGGDDESSVPVISGSDKDYEYEKVFIDPIKENQKDNKNKNRNTLFFFIGLIGASISLFLIRSLKKK